MTTTDHRATARIQTTTGTRPKAGLLPCSSSLVVLIYNKSAVVLLRLSSISGALVSFIGLFAFERFLTSLSAGAPATGHSQRKEAKI